MIVALVNIGWLVRNMMLVVGGMTVLFLKILRFFFFLFCDFRETW